MHQANLICTVAAVIALCLAALHDVAVRTVPNVLIAAIAGCGLTLAVFQHRLPASTAMMALLFAATFLLWLRGYLGGGDVKLLGTSGLLVPPGAVIPMLLATALAGGVLCLPYLPGRRLFSPPASGRPNGMLARLIRCEQRRLYRRGPLPYAVAIAAGTISALLHGA